MRRLVAGIIAALLVASPVSADHSGVGWPSGDIRVLTNVLGTPLEANFRTAVAQWDASPHITLTVDAARSCKKQRRAVVLCAVPGSNQWAQLDYQRGYLSAVYAQVPSLQADAFIGMVCHELGHGLGLFHTADHDSCMYSWETDGVGGVQTIHPSVHDYEALADLYG